MSDLAGFLLARIAEDEARARDARGYQTGSRYEGQPFDWQLHLERWWSPGRVLAECEAKRRMIELAEEASVLDGSLDAEFSGTIGYKGGGPDVGDRILLALALPYADHAEFRDEWRAE